MAIETLACEKPVVAIRNDKYFIGLITKDNIEYACKVNFDGKDKKVLSMIGKKSKKQPPESFYPIVLMTRVESDGDGNNNFYFQTRASNSSAKTPIGMFDDFEIPNSLKLVDTTIRNYYKIN